MESRHFANLFIERQKLIANIPCMKNTTIQITGQAEGISEFSRRQHNHKGKSWPASNTETDALLSEHIFWTIFHILRMQGVELIKGSRTFTVKKLQDFYKTLQNRKNLFPVPSWSPPTFKYKDKQQLLTVHTKYNSLYGMPTISKFVSSLYFDK